MDFNVIKRNNIMLQRKSYRSMHDYDGFHEIIRSNRQRNNRDENDVNNLCWNNYRSDATITHGIIGDGRSRQRCRRNTQSTKRNKTKIPTYFMPIYNNVKLMENEMIIEEGMKVIALKDIDSKLISDSNKKEKIDNKDDRLSMIADDTSPIVIDKKHV